MSVVTSVVWKERRLSLGSAESCQHIPRLTGEEASVRKWEGGMSLLCPECTPRKRVALDPR